MHEYAMQLHTEGELIAVFFGLFAFALLGVLLYIAVLLTRLSSSMAAQRTTATSVPSAGQRGQLQLSRAA